MTQARREAAVVYADGWFQDVHAKVAHGLVRGSSRFDVVAIIDASCAGADAGELLDGQHRDIPVVASLDDLDGLRRPPTTWIIGIATHGGRFTHELRHAILGALSRRFHLVNGLHDCLQDDPEIAALAAAASLRLVDIRRPKSRDELHFWTGDILGCETPRIAVLGTDCALGKRTTTKLLVEELGTRGVGAEMIYTGQTGWLQGAAYGFILDATLNDYVSGELEHALLACHAEAQPDVMLIEGQSALRNPCGPCGSELLLSGAVHGVVLQHAPAREFFEGYEEQKCRIPPVPDEVELIARYGVPTLAVALNGAGLTPAQRATEGDALRQQLGIPVVAVLEDGPGALVDAVQSFLQKDRS